MTENTFIEKFRSKSDSELEQIAMNSTSFVLEARLAAVTILKDRGYDSPLIKKAEREVEREVESLENEELQKTKEAEAQEERFIRRILQVPIKEAKKYRLKNGNVLLVKRINQNTFQVRIQNNYRADLMPVLICKLRDDKTFFRFPFLYLKPILFYGMGGSATLGLLAVLKNAKIDMDTFLFPIIITVGIQLMMMPFAYFFVFNTLKKRLGDKSKN